MPFRADPWLHVIAGCMSSGKTDELLRLLRRAEIARRRMLLVLAHADAVTMLTAICVVCGDPATRTQRLVGGRPAAIDDPLVVIGGFDTAAAETYEARCHRHHEIGEPRGRGATTADAEPRTPETAETNGGGVPLGPGDAPEIGRASCRER